MQTQPLACGSQELLPGCTRRSLLRAADGDGSPRCPSARAAAGAVGLRSLGGFYPSAIVKTIRKHCLVREIKSLPARAVAFPGSEPFGVQTKAAPPFSDRNSRVCEGVVARFTPTHVLRCVSPRSPPGIARSSASGQVPEKKSYLKQTDEPQDHHHHRGTALGLTPPLMTDGWCH